MVGSVYAVIVPGRSWFAEWEKRERELSVTSLALQLANVRHLAQSVALSLPITRNQHTKESRKGLRDLEDTRAKQEHKCVKNALYCSREVCLQDPGCLQMMAKRPIYSVAPRLKMVP